jgi:plastocyanin
MKASSYIITGILSLMIVLNINEAQATKWIVNVQNYSFSPSNLPNVIVGDTIRWVWVSGSHTTTSTTIPAGAASWDHPITSGNPTYEYRVTVAGNYNYKCTPHAGMGMVGSFTATGPTPALVSINPDQATQGDTFTATIVGSNTNFNGSPSVSLSFSGNPNETINATDVTVLSSTVLHAQFTIGMSASVGLWDLHVGALSLADCFTVNQAPIPSILSISPDNGGQGSLVSATITGENTLWSGNSPVVLLALHVNPAEVITGININVLSNTALSADFDLPYDATPGLWDLYIDTLELQNCFTVIDVVPYLVSIEPDSANQGEQVTTLITAADSRFTLLNPSISLSYSLNSSEVITASNISVLNDFQAEAVFDIPAEASAGSWDVNVDDMILSSGFTINLLSGITNESSLAAVRIYPNPASQALFIENARGALLTIIATGGETVISLRINSEKQGIDVGNLTRGIYIVRMRIDGREKSEKLLLY